MPENLSPKMLIKVFRYHLPESTICRKLTGFPLRILGPDNIKNEQPLEFYGYRELLKQKESAIVCNDTALIKEYPGFLRDIINSFGFMCEIETPFIAGVLTTSLFGADMRRAGPSGKHIQSHIYLTNATGAHVMREGITRILKTLKPSDMSLALATRFFNNEHFSRKALAMQAEIELSSYLFEHCTVMDILMDKRIKCKLELYRLLLRIT